MKINIIKSPAKINLALNVIGKSRSLHKVESLVSFINLFDIISVKEIKEKKHRISFDGLFSKNIKKKNTISELLNILDKKNLLNSKKFQITIKKNIPQEAGLGGGSINAASLISYFLKKKILKISTTQITKICNLVGSDVILGIYSKNLILNPNGKIIPLQKSKKINVLLIKPNFGCSTKKIFSYVSKYSKPVLKKSKIKLTNFNYLKRLKNDLEPLAMRQYPKLNQIKKYLNEHTKSKLVRMTGSGSVIVGYFSSKKDCELAKLYMKKKFRNYWCIIAKTI